MANRNILALSKIDDFKDWLVSDGWKLQKTEGVWEIVRARKDGRKYPLIIYKKMNTENGNTTVHCSVLNRDVGVVRAYLRERKAAKKEPPFCDPLWMTYQEVFEKIDKVKMRMDKPDDYCIGWNDALDALKEVL